jgi:aminoglycoside phosphotransferase (APT) family kinase protein
MAGVTAEQRERLRAAGPALKELCARLAASRVPATLVHGDLHLANVAQSAAGYLFFDWCDAAVSHPFLDMSDILHEADPDIRARLRDSYLAVWTDYEPLDRLEDLWRMAHPLCALHQAVSYRSLIRHTEPRNRPDLAWAMPFWAEQILSSLKAVGGSF